MNNEKIIEQVLTALKNEVPEITIQDDNEADVEWAVELPEQDGLSYPVWLGLQNEDELTLCIGKFQNEWFPCMDDDVVDHFMDAVTGFIKGQYRLEEHYRGNKLLRTHLQVFEENDWKTISTCYQLALTFPWQKKETKIVQNKIID